MNGVKHLVLRGGVYWYVRRVPKNLSEIEPRKYIKVSLKTGDFNEAVLRIAKVGKETDKYFDNLVINGVSESGKEKYEKAIQLAQRFGLEYKEVEQIAEGSLDNLSHRLDLAEKHIENPRVVDAVLGGISKPVIKLSNVPNLYFDLAKGDVLDKNKVQTRIWKNSRIRAVNNLKGSVGNDIDIAELNKNHALNFRDWWLGRIVDQDYSEKTANKEFGHIDLMIRTIREHHRLPYVPLFSGLRFKNADTKLERLPLATDFILENMLAEGALPGLLAAGKALINLMADSGCRPSELVGLDPDEELHLDNSIPYIHIKKNKYRTLKTKNSERELPLVGYSLIAAQNGAFDLFEKYRANPTTLTNYIGMYFRHNDFLPSKQYSLYSLRHSFDDRMTAAEVPDRLQAQLMGHKLKRTKYGLGATLSHRQKWMKKFALPMVK